MTHPTTGRRERKKAQTRRPLTDAAAGIGGEAAGMWLRRETALAEVLAEEPGRDADEVTVRALAHYALAAPRLAGGSEGPAAAVDRIFTLLEQGWGGLGA